MKHMTCEICGADILAKAGGTFVCTGCGMQYDKEKILEMAAQCHQEPEKAEILVPTAEELQAISDAVPPQQKHNYRKMLVAIGIAAVCLIAFMMVLLPLRKSWKSAAAPAKTEAALEAVRNSVEEDIEGLWYYEDPEIGWHEEHYFRGGLVASLTWLDSAPEKASNDVGKYEVLDGQIRRQSLNTDYVIYCDYYYEGDELVLSWYVDDGRDAGSSRVYRKISDSSGPSKFPSGKSDTNGTTSNSDAANVTTGMKNALKKAESYLSIMAFSRQGLIDQLEFDGFTYSEAAYAVDACGADWNQQAVKRAENYLDIMTFSRQGLIDQLVYDGFLYDEAVYGVDKVY